MKLDVMGGRGTRGRLKDGHVTESVCRARQFIVAAVHWLDWKEVSWGLRAGQTQGEAIKSGPG